MKQTNYHFFSGTRDWYNDFSPQQVDYVQPNLLLHICPLSWCHEK